MEFSICVDGHDGSQNLAVRGHLGARRQAKPASGHPRRFRSRPVCQSSRSSHSHFPAVRGATCYRTEDILIGDSGLDRLDRPEQSAICDEGT